MIGEWYENYLENVAQTPNEKYRNDMQASIESKWENSTLISTVKEETYIGSFEFESIELWKNTISSFSINGVKNEKDYRRLTFRDTSHISDRGLYYKFDTNYWIVYEGTIEETTLNQVSVRRCNNEMRWIDRENGKLHSMPCVLDNEVSSPTPKVNKNITLPNGHIVVWVQGNDITKKIKKNQRFIFNGDPYKFASYNAQMQSNYATEEVPLIFMDMYLDEIQPTDNVENNIANDFENQYEINILQDDFEQRPRSSGELSAEVKINGKVVDRDITWKSLTPDILIDFRGVYTIIGESGTEGTIRAYISGNEEIYDTVRISIKDDAVDKKEIVIKPVYEEISQNELAEFEANVYINNAWQRDKVIGTVKNLDSSYYTFTSKTNNKFELVSKKISKTPLQIEFTSGELSKVIEIELKSMF